MDVTVAYVLLASNASWVFRRLRFAGPLNTPLWFSSRNKINKTQFLNYRDYVHGLCPLPMKYNSTRMTGVLTVVPFRGCNLWLDLLPLRVLKSNQTAVRAVMMKWWVLLLLFVSIYNLLLALSKYFAKSPWVITTISIVKRLKKIQN